MDRKSQKFARRRAGGRPGASEEDASLFVSWRAERPPRSGFRQFREIELCVFVPLVLAMVGVAGDLRPAIPTFFVMYCFIKPIHRCRLEGAIGA